MQIKVIMNICILITIFNLILSFRFRNLEAQISCSTAGIVEHLSTLDCLQDYVTDDCICVVLESVNANLANKMMLDCIISKLTCKENLLDFFDQLEKIPGVDSLRSIINDLC